MHHEEYKKEFTIDGLNIVSEVIDIVLGEQGAIVTTIKTSFGSRSKVTNHTDCIGESGYKDRLYKVQESNAELFAREIRGVANQPMVFQGIRIYLESKNEWSAVLLSSVDEGLSNTAIQKGLEVALGLPSAGMCVVTNAGTGYSEKCETFHARIKLWDEVYEDFRVVPVDMQNPCVLGRDVISKVKSQDSRSYYKLLDNDLDRAIRNGVRSKENTILLIGSFQDDDRKKLEKVREVLFINGYRGITLDDFTDIEDQTLEEKLILYASLSKFVLCLDINPAGHYVELITCARCGFITSIILGGKYGEGFTSSFMISDLAIRNSFIRFTEIKDDDISFAIEDSIKWAEEEARRKANLLNGQYPWRD